MIALLIVCHLIGDFLLQNHWMQRKSQSPYVCTVHVCLYSWPFMILGIVHPHIIPPWALGLILIQHWLQDRFALHLKWMKLYGQTPPEQWPMGPLLVDQAMHIAFLGLIGYLIDPVL